MKATRKAFGDYPIISVNFPCDKDENYAMMDKQRRAENLQHLLNELSKIEYESIKPEVLSHPKTLKEIMCYNISKFQIKITLHIET